MVMLVPMTHAEFRAFALEAVPAFAAENVASGHWSDTESLELARNSFDALLPLGLETSDHYLFTIFDDSALPLGFLWAAIRKRAEKRVAYVYDIYIDPEHRRRGYATAALLEFERKASDLGFSGVQLHVFGRNSGAQALYAKLGFSVTDITMFKSLEPEADA